MCDLTYLRTWAGFAYLALVIDVYSRRSVGWALTAHLRTALALEALEMAIWDRRDRHGQPVHGLIHHSDAGSQYLAIRYTDAIAGAGALAPVGSVGDSYDNALAESTIGQIKAELIHRRGPWRTVDQLEYALFEYIDWWNHRRLHGEIGMRHPPRPRPPTTLNPGHLPRPVPNEPSLYRTQGGSHRAIRAQTLRRSTRTTHPPERSDNGSSRCGRRPAPLPAYQRAFR